MIRLWLTWFPKRIPLPRRTRGNRGSCQSQSSDDQRTRRRTDSLRWDLAILWASAALCGVARTSSCAYIQQGRRKRRRRRRDAPARLAGKRALANPGSPSTDRDTLELLFQQPSCSSNLSVLVALERLPATMKSMTGHLTILLAFVQHRFKLVASLEKCELFEENIASRKRSRNSRRDQIKLESFSNFLLW